MQDWLEVAVIVVREAAETVAAQMIELGSNGVVEEPLDASPTHVRLKGYFADTGAGREALAALRSRCHADVTVATLPDQDWNSTWKSFFTPLRVSRRVVVRPSWCEYQPTPQDVVLTLDPGMAFGTGTHPSTRMCLEVVDELLAAAASPADAQLLDVGTGTGILSIAALLLGAGRALALDNDPQALAGARVNGTANQVMDRLVVTDEPLHAVAGRFDIVVANILAHVLIGMCPDLLARMAPGGRLLLSGIVPEQAAAVIDAFVPPLQLVRRIEDDEWVALLLQHG